MFMSPLVQNIMKVFLKLKMFMLNPLTFNTFHLLKQTEELIEPYWANNSEISDNDILKNVVHG